MQSAPKPDNEKNRLEKLRQYKVLDTSPEEPFDRITRLASHILKLPIVLISLVDDERQWFKSKVGIDADETARDIAFCSHAILGDNVFVVENAAKDHRFADNPLVSSGPKIRFYAGAPLKTHDGYNLGTLCAIDTKPHRLSKEKRRMLEDLAKIAIDEMELRIAAREAMNENAKLVKSQSLKDEFIAVVNHELRTPLTSIIGGLGLLTTGKIENLSEPAFNLVSIAYRNAKNLKEIVDDLLDMQKLESGKLEFSFDTFETSRLVHESIESIKPTADERKISLQIGELVEGRSNGDFSRLRQVLLNLLSNAIKFSPEGGGITLSCHHKAGAVYFTVQDQGMGISEEFRPHVFSRFRQDNFKGKIKGTGLGLAISQAIAHAHGGEISFDTKIGAGTTFHLRIPHHPAVSATT